MSFRYSHHIDIRLQLPADETKILALHQAAFGPGRFAKTAFRIREQTCPAKELCFVAEYNEQLLGSVMVSHICIGNEKALFLGPLAVLPDQRHKGIGKLLMNKTLSKARRLKYKAILLVGDAPYYTTFGFHAIPSQQVYLPGPVDPARLLVCVLHSNDPFKASGCVTGIKN